MTPLFSPEDKDPVPEALCSIQNTVQLTKSRNPVKRSAQNLVSMARYMYTWKMDESGAVPDYGK
jgi:hypothetical protein